MNGLIEYIVGGLVDYPDEVTVDLDKDGDVDVYEVEVHEDDIGRIIGRQGRTANALRAVVGAAAAKKGERAQVEILD
ncbi:MAG: KH domain-containing protein [Myxococcota bacterium]|nr:KH domain-containing protein [Myxococcota bacterium]